MSTLLERRARENAAVREKSVGDDQCHVGAPEYVRGQFTGRKAGETDGVSYSGGIQPFRKDALFSGAINLAQVFLGTLGRTGEVDKALVRARVGLIMEH